MEKKGSQLHKFYLLHCEDNKQLSCIKVIAHIATKLLAKDFVNSNLLTATYVHVHIEEICSIDWGAEICATPTFNFIFTHFIASLPWCYI